MKCLETRRRNGMKWRRYRTEEGAVSPKNLRVPSASWLA